MKIYRISPSFTFSSMPIMFIEAENEVAAMRKYFENVNGCGVVAGVKIEELVNLDKIIK